MSAKSWQTMDLIMSDKKEVTSSCNSKLLIRAIRNLKRLFQQKIHLLQKNKMSAAESDQLVDKITAGVKLSIQRLIERTKKEDGELVISRHGKVLKIKARELKPQS
jgi:hypothetical protein